MCCQFRGISRCQNVGALPYLKIEHAGVHRRSQFSFYGWRLLLGSRYILMHLKVVAAKLEPIRVK